MALGISSALFLRMASTFLSNPTILTLIASVFGKRATEAQASFEQQIERERVGLAVEINTFLFDKQKATNVTMNASLAGAIAKLLNATDALEDVAKNLAKTTKKVDRGA